MVIYQIKSFCSSRVKSSSLSNGANFIVGLLEVGLEGEITVSAENFWQIAKIGQDSATVNVQRSEDRLDETILKSILR